MPHYSAQNILNTATGLPPHAGMMIHSAGVPINDARCVAILVHGRGAGAGGILSLAGELNLDDVAYLVPEASGRAWYPFSFLSPVEANEPGLSSGLSVLEGLVVGCERFGISASNIALIGFSQGACLALEYAIRHPRRYKALIGFSGGLIGPAGTVWESRVAFDKTPVFLGCSDRDPHIPAERVRETGDVFMTHGASVDVRFYPGLPHTIIDDEISVARDLLSPEREREA